MSRSGYGDGECNIWLYRQAVERAIAGKRGQAFLREMLAALDALPEKRLVSNSLVSEQGCCAMGAVGLARGVEAEMANIDPGDPAAVSYCFGIAWSMAAEIAHMNDGRDWGPPETEEQRFARMRRWVVSEIRGES